MNFISNEGIGNFTEKYRQQGFNSMSNKVYYTYTRIILIELFTDLGRRIDFIN